MAWIIDNCDKNDKYLIIKKSNDSNLKKLSTELE